MTTPATLPSITAGGLRWRPAVVEDAQIVVDMANAMYEADAAPYRESVDEARAELAAPWRNLDTDSLLGFDEAGELRGEFSS